jgi:hypothetical protein
MPLLLAVLITLVHAGSAHAQDTTGVGTLRGIVTTSTQEPAPDVAICLVETGRCAVTDAQGTFTLADVRAGRYRLEIVATGQLPLTSSVDVRAGLEATVEVTLPDSGALQETVTVSAPQFVTAEEVKNSAFLVSSSEILRSAGALQDVTRYVQTLPGVVIASNDFRNDLIVRGGSPLENLYIVDNVEIPNINTFANFASAGGTVSILDAQLIQDVTFLTGGFPASYGNRTSSVLQTTLREGSRERVTGRATVGFAGAGVVAEGPLPGQRGSWIVSGRRSFLDLFTDDVGIGGVPVQYTLNGKLVVDINPRHRLWLLNVAGVDEVRLGLAEGSDPSEELSNLDIRYDGWRSATGFNWQQTFGTRGVGLFGVTYSSADVRQRVQDLLRNGVPPPGTPVDEQLAGGVTVFAEDSAESESTVKYDFTAYAPVIQKLQAGASVRRYAIDYNVASPYGTDSPYFVAPDQNPFALREQDSTQQFSGYVQSSQRVSSRIGWTLGARVDHYAFLGATRVSPRGGVSYDLSTDWSLRASVGRFYQQPFFLFLTAFPENRTLVPFRADHFVVGADWTAGATRLTAEYYEKRYDEYPVSRDIPSLSIANLGDTFAVRDILFPLVSSGTGTAHGIEIHLEQRATNDRPLSGQLNVAVSRTRHAGRDGIERAGSFDYPVVVNVLGGYRLSSTWEISLRASYLSGRPYTPFDTALSAAQRRGIYDLTQVNGARSSDYFRADIRIDRAFRVNDQPLTVFLGVQNVTNRKNIAGFSWDRRNNIVSTEEQLGIFPILGLDWQF